MNFDNDPLGKVSGSDSSSSPKAVIAGEIFSPPRINNIPRKHYKVIIVSDIHIPRSDSRSDLLAEFLTYNSCDTLILNGDTHEGYDERLEDLRPNDLLLMNLIHHLKKQGVRVIDIPGNHDAYKRSKKILEKQIFGTEYQYDLLIKNQDAPVYVFHGDILDGDYTRRYGQFLYKLAKLIPLGSGMNLIDLYSKIEFLTNSITAKRINKTTKGKYRQQALSLAFRQGANSVISGHTHKPSNFSLVEFKDHTGEKRRAHYANSGAWTDNQATALVLDENDQWHLIDWNSDRSRYFSPSMASQTLVPHNSEYSETSFFEHQWQRAAHGSFIAEKLLQDAQGALREIDKAKNKLRDFIERMKAQHESAVTNMEGLSSYAEIMPAQKKPQKGIEISSTLKPPLPK